MNDVDSLLYFARISVNIALVFILPVAITYGTIICCKRSGTIFTSLHTVRDKVRDTVKTGIPDELLSRLYRSLVHRWPDSSKVNRHKKRCKFKKSGWRRCKRRKSCRKKAKTKNRTQQASPDQTNNKASLKPPGTAQLPQPLVPSTSDPVSINELTENQSMISNEFEDAELNNSAKVEQCHGQSHSIPTQCHSHSEGEQFILVLPVGDTDYELNKTHICYGNQKHKCTFLKATNNEMPTLHKHWQSMCESHCSEY